MTKGLYITQHEFDKLKQSQQLTILYSNTEEIKKLLSSYQFHKKIQYVWLTILSSAVCIVLGIKSRIGF